MHKEAVAEKLNIICNSSLFLVSRKASGTHKNIIMGVWFLPASREDICVNKVRLIQVPQDFEALRRAEHGIVLHHQQNSSISRRLGLDAEDHPFAEQVGNEKSWNQDTEPRPIDHRQLM